MTNSMQELWGSSHLSAGHSAYLETLYEKYLNKPEELSKEWLEFFNTLPNSSNGHVEYLIKVFLMSLKIYQELQ